MLVGDAHDARDELAVDACPQFDGGAVRADGDEVAGRDRTAFGVVRRQLELAVGALELKLGDALDGRPGEEWAVAEQAQVREEGPVAAALFARGRARRDLGGLTMVQCSMLRCSLAAVLPYSRRFR